MTVSSDRLVRNQVIFREVNERIRELAEQLGTKSGVTFICECSGEDCVEWIDLELDDYRAIRSSPKLFIVVPGHETLEVENVVQTSGRYAVVEKIRSVDLVTESHQPIPEREA